MVGISALGVITLGLLAGASMLGSGGMVAGVTGIGGDAVGGRAFAPLSAGGQRSATLPPTLLVVSPIKSIFRRHLCSSCLLIQLRYIAVAIRKPYRSRPITEVRDRLRSGVAIRDRVLSLRSDWSRSIHMMVVVLKRRICHQGAAMAITCYVEVHCHVLTVHREFG